MSTAGAQNQKIVKNKGNHNHKKIIKRGDQPLHPELPCLRAGGRAPRLCAASSHLQARSSASRCKGARAGTSSAVAGPTRRLGTGVQVRRRCGWVHRQL
jgi:hypothetical protein